QPMDQHADRLGAAGRASTPRSPGGLPTRWRRPGGRDPPALARADRAGFALMPPRARAPMFGIGRRAFHHPEELRCSPEPLPSPAQVGESLVPFVLDVVSAIDDLEEPELMRTKRVGAGDALEWSLRVPILIQPNLTASTK